MATTTKTEVEDLLRWMAETHRPAQRRDPFAPVGVERLQVHCPACDAGLWRIWRAGDEPFACKYWREYQKLVTTS